jgi:sorbitol-specific phosphotransferase system component IIBC
MGEIITTALDTLAVLLIAAGAAALAFPYLGWGALAVAGVVVLAGSQIAAGALDGVFARRKAKR